MAACRRAAWFTENIMVRYWWLLICLMVSLAGLAVVQAAEAQTPTPLKRIGFGSCVNQDKPQPIWETIVAARPDLFLMCGDNVYANVTKKADLGKFKQCYDKLAAQPGYQKLLKTCPLMAVWDDHDYGYNDAGGDYVLKKESQQIFLDFFGVPKDSPRRRQEGVYYAQTFGPADKSVQVIMLDTRYFRSKLKPIDAMTSSKYLPDNDPKATFLGEVQWKWFEEQLRQPARLRLVVSTIQLVAEDHPYEKWMNFPAERARFFKVLKDTKAQGVVVLSGDRHLAELSSMDAGLGYPLFDLTSSGLTEGYTKGWRKPEVNKNRVATMTHGNNFGMVLVDWERKDPQVSLQIRDEAGDIAIQEKISLSWLQAGGKKKGM
ncbi:MAG TPA: alkaline phosphatase D family protein [Gemmataceae bacterium]|nr:alkaline phosphatase D family protein [Gemmataceae bacterium]